MIDEKHKKSLYSNINNISRLNSNEDEDSYIYPKAISEQLNIDIIQAFSLLNKLQGENVLKRVYEFRCTCGKYNKKFKNINFINLPTTIVCGHCKKEFILRDNLYIAYQINNKENNFKKEY